jgi:DNA-binding LacI/PurR family transcriptional regulator
MTKPFKRILFTGAAGNLGRRLRERLHEFADVVRLSDMAEIGPAGPGEEVFQCDLADRDQVFRMCEGVDAILHFGGVSTELEFEPIMQANILGLVNLYEAVHTLGIRRVVFASTNHTMGMYRSTDRRRHDADPADGYYGVSKVFGESLSRFYWDRFGIETVCLRIGYCWPEPTNYRQMVTWLGPRRPGAAAAPLAADAARRPHDRLRRLGQPGPLVGRPPRAPPGLPADAEFERVRAPDSRQRRLVRSRGHHADAPGRRLPDEWTQVQEREMTGEARTAASGAGGGPAPAPPRRPDLARCRQTGRRGPDHGLARAEHAGAVSPEILARVRSAVERTGYVPNILAGGLASRQTRLVAAIVPTISSPVFLEMIEALTRSLTAAGYQLMLGQSGYTDSREDELLEAIIGRRADGVVLTGVMRSPLARRRLLASGIPVVETWDLTPTPIDMLVGFSHGRLGSAVAAYLHGRGRRRVAIISADDERARQRTAAFIQTAQALKLAGPDGRCRPATCRADHGGAWPQRLARAAGGASRHRRRVLQLGHARLGVLNEAHAQGIAVPGTAGRDRPGRPGLRARPVAGADHGAHRRQRDRRDRRAFTSSSASRGARSPSPYAISASRSSSGRRSDAYRPSHHSVGFHMTRLACSNPHFNRFLAALARHASSVPLAQPPARRPEFRSRFPRRRRDPAVSRRGAPGSEAATQAEQWTSSRTDAGRATSPCRS